MKLANEEVTQTGVTIGTPEFMPPEQAAGRRDAVDARSDVWGLGATLYTAITGRYVHDDAQSLHEQLIASATHRAPPIRQLAPHVPPAVARVIDRALELDMDDRWQSASDMQAAFRDARGPRVEDYTADSLTVRASSHEEGPREVGPLAHEAGPASIEEPESSDRTRQLPAPRRSYPDPPPGAAGDDAATLAKTQASPALVSAPAPRLHERVAPPPPPGTTRMRGPFPVCPRQGQARFRAPPGSGTPTPRPGDVVRSAARLGAAAGGAGACRRRRPPASDLGRGRGRAPSSPLSEQPRARRSAARAVVVVTLLLLLVCGAIGAYVLWQDAARGR